MTESLSVDRGGGKEPSPAARGTIEVRICRGPGCKNVLTGRQTKFCCDQCRHALQSMQRKEGEKQLNGRGKMRAARAKNSPRLRRLLRELLDYEWHTTMELQQGAQLCAVGTSVGELRRNGFDIECERVKGTKETVFRYRLVKEEAA